MTKRMTAGILVLALVTGALAGVTFSQGSVSTKKAVGIADDMVFGWTAPTTGSTPTGYEVEIRKGGMFSTDIRQLRVTEARVTIQVEWLTLYEVRVRAHDAHDNFGPWSKWSVAEDRDRDEPSF